jgi:hypothetical protein
MIITPDFVFINNPRTGTTFARKAITAAYAAVEQPPSELQAVREVMLPIHRGRGQSGRDHHGTYAQIPRRYTHLPVVSAVRNPFTLLVANFELGLWRPHQIPRDPTGELDRCEDGSFDFFVRVQELAMRRRWGMAFGRPGFGPLAAHHLRMFARKPRTAIEAVIAGASDNEIESQIGQITFLRQEYLSEDLSKFITRCGNRVSLDAIRGHPPSHVTRRSQRWSHASFTDEMVARIRQRDDFLFRSLSRSGIDYSFANADFFQRQR